MKNLLIKLAPGIFPINANNYVPAINDIISKYKGTFTPVDPINMAKVEEAYNKKDKYFVRENDGRLVKLTDKYPKVPNTEMAMEEIVKIPMRDIYPTFDIYLKGENYYLDKHNGIYGKWTCEKPKIHKWAMGDCLLRLKKNVHSIVPHCTYERCTTFAKLKQLNQVWWNEIDILKQITDAVVIYKKFLQENLVVFADKGNIIFDAFFETLTTDDPNTILISLLYEPIEQGQDFEILPDTKEDVEKIISSQK